MEPLVFIISVLIGYLLGSISFARIGLRVAGADSKISELEIPVEGADESARVEIFGANAASMILGAKGGIAIGIMDMLKAALPMAIFRFFLFPAEPYYLVISVAALIGHNYPLYFGFKGGRGFSVIFGSLIIVDWMAAILLPIIGILFGLFVAANMMIGYVGWLLFMPPWLWLRTFDSIHLVYSILIVTLFFISTKPEISTIARYRREGKLEEYMEGLYSSSPRWRGMKRMQDGLTHLGRKRYLIGFVVLAAIIVLFLNLSAFPG
jgi:glycerol-3-phosphate acyltransferase PlsY